MICNERDGNAEELQGDDVEKRDKQCKEMSKGGPKYGIQGIVSFSLHVDCLFVRDRP